MKQSSLLVLVGLSSTGIAIEVPQGISNGFADFDKKGVAAQLRYEAEIYSAPHPLSADEVAKMRARFEAQKMDPVMIEEFVRSAADTKGKTRKKSVEIVVLDGVMKCTLLAGKGLEPKSVEWTNGNLICTSLSPSGSWEYSIERPAFYSAPHALGQRFLPWCLGLFSLERLFENKGEVSGETISRTFQWEKNRSVHVDANWSKDAKEFTFQQTFGQRSNGPTEVIKLSDWKTIDGHSLPGQIVLTTLRQVDKSVHSRMTIKLVSAKFGSEVKTADLPSLGPVGKEVSDCRFGNDACVRYKIPERPLSDAEVQALLDAKDKEGRPLALGEKPPPPPPTGPSNLIYLGGGAVVLGAGLLLLLKRK